MVDYESRLYSFFQSEMTLSIYLDEKIIDPSGQRQTKPQVLITANYPLLVRNALAKTRC